MTSYFATYLILMVFTLSYKKGFVIEDQKNTSWILIGLFFTFFIGLRDYVGGDWSHYARHFQNVSYYTLEEILKRSDPGYYAINWMMSEWGFEIYSVNVICGALFMTGLITFSKRQPNPYLAISVAIPYLVVVIAMGYTRQAVALGFLFWGLTALEKNQFKKFLIFMILAATFHKSAVLMIGLGLFLQGKGKFIRIVAVAFVGIGIYNAFLANYQQDLWKNYVEVQMESQGAQIRVAMNFIPAIIFLLYRKEWKKQFNDFPFWLMISIGSIVSIFIVNFASTAVDRVALYFTPIQVVVYARLPYLLKDKFNPQTITFGILAFYFLVLFVWLNYATHSKYWLPYKFALFDNVL